MQEEEYSDNDVSKDIKYTRRTCIALIRGLWCLKFSDWIGRLLDGDWCERINQYPRGDECKKCKWLSAMAFFLGKPLKNLPLYIPPELEESGNKDIAFCKHGNYLVRVEGYPGEQEDVWVLIPRTGNCRCKKPVSKSYDSGDF